MACFRSHRRSPDCSSRLDYSKSVLYGGNRRDGTRQISSDSSTGDRIIDQHDFSNSYVQGGSVNGNSAISIPSLVLHDSQGNTVRWMLDAHEMITISSWGYMCSTDQCRRRVQEGWSWDSSLQPCCEAESWRTSRLSSTHKIRGS